VKKLREDEEYEEITYYDDDGKKKTEKIKKKDLEIGKPGMMYDEEGNEYTYQEFMEKQRLKKLLRELQNRKIDGRTNKEKIRDYIIERGGASRKELMSFFIKNEVNYPLMSEKTLDNNIKKLKEENTIILQDPDNLFYIYNIDKPLVKSEYTGHRTIRAYHILKKNRDDSFKRMKHFEIKSDLMHYIDYNIYYKGEEDNEFYFSNLNMQNLSVIVNDLLYKCFLGNPDLFYRFRKKDDFHFSLLITLDLTTNPNFDEFFKKYYTIKEMIFKGGFPTLAKKITTEEDIENFIKACEERQKAVAKLQHEERDKGIREILASGLTDNEKSYAIQELLQKLELDAYKKFSPFAILKEFGDLED
jgi:hypothetical protein